MKIDIRKKLILLTSLIAIAIAIVLSSDEGYSTERVSKDPAPNFLMSSDGLVVVIFTKNDCSKCREMTKRAVRVGNMLPSEVKVNFLEANVEEEMPKEKFNEVKDKLPLCFIMKKGTILASVPSTASDEDLKNTILFLNVAHDK